MPTNDELLEATLDHLGAARLTLMAFMMEVSVRLTEGKPDPVGWARSFISDLHHRLDQHEASLGEEATEQPFHEAARENIDVVGNFLLQAVKPRQE